MLSPSPVQLQFESPSLQWIPRTLSLSQSLPVRPSPIQLARDKIQDHDKVQLTSEYTKAIRDVIAEMLSQCNIPYPRTPYDHDLHDLCIQECELKRYPIDNKIHGKVSLLKYIPWGVVMGCTAYAHLKSRPTQVFISLITAFFFWVDDTYTRDVIGVDSFNDRFVHGRKQANEGFDAFDRFLREIHTHWHGIQANVILTSALNFITSTILEFETQGMLVSPHAKSYALFQRMMSGASEAYAMFMFPPEAPVKTYFQAVPACCVHINHVNDVLSFYKEELAGEVGTTIDLEAAKRGVEKIRILEDFAREASFSASRVADILEGNKEAKAAWVAWRHFLVGYTSFHTSSESRYRLNDLFPL